MNKRQAKKQFKKQYGMNPKEYERWCQEHWPEITKAAVQQAANNLSEGLKALANAAVEAGKQLSESMKYIGEAMREAVKYIQEQQPYIEAENMLRESNLLPEGVDKELLRHIGIRMDRSGGAYDFYYDEQNDAYFVEILQEGGENHVDGNIMDDFEGVGNVDPDHWGSRSADHSD